MLEIQPHFMHNYFSTNYMQEIGKCNQPVNLIDRIKTNEIEIDCCVEANTNRKVLTCSGEHHYSFRKFLSEAPKNIDLSALAKALNYLLNGLEGFVITDPDTYRKEHEKLVTLSATTDPRLIELNQLNFYCQDNFDTSKIEPPKILEASFEFFIDIHHTPYKISCGWPVDTDPPVIKKEVLPPVNEPLF